MKKVVLHHISSDIGKNSSIGYRSEMIYEYSKEKIKINIICRSNKSVKRGNNIWSIDISFYLSRLFLFINLHLFKNFSSRKYELFFFNFFSLPYVIFHYLSNIKNKKYFHSWDSSLWLLVIIKKLNYIIIKDCAMTPSKSSILESKKNKEYYFDNNTTLKYTNIEKKIFDISEIIISPSFYTTNFISKHYEISKHKIKTIPFGVNLQKDIKNKNTNDINSKIISLGFVGLVNMRKGIRWFVKVLNELQEESDFLFELHIFGRIFKDEVQTINSANFKIIKHGYIKNKSNIFKSFDILVHPSFIEGSAKCIYEAMNHSLPIICTYQSGSIVHNNVNGFIINAGDTIGLKKALIFYFLNKKQIRIMGRNSKKIISKYSWQNYSENVLQNYLTNN